MVVRCEFTLKTKPGALVLFCMIAYLGIRARRSSAAALLLVPPPQLLLTIRGAW